MTVLRTIPHVDAADLRAHCQGVLPLSGRLEPWMVQLLSSSNVFEWVERYGSPLNVIETGPMLRNLSELVDTARQRRIDFQPYFARKANKCLSFVDEANAAGCGIDTASEDEVRQCLDRGVLGSDIICTAAIKSETLIRLCVQQGICIAIDNHDELHLAEQTSRDLGRSVSIAVRVGGFDHNHQKLPTRFGLDVTECRYVIDQLERCNVRVDGIHFHLDGYDADQRVSAIMQSLDWIEQLRSAGHDPVFLDIGGGFPVCYLESRSQWQAFWEQHQASILGHRDAITYRRHGLGLVVHHGQTIGRRNVYPFYQRVTKARWFANILDTVVDAQPLADRLRRANVQLRCEPGRSLLDGCGVTIARVESRKRGADGDWLIGLSMNRTQCRTTSDDFLVDPIVLSHSGRRDEAMQGYLVGAYCTESELLSLRKLSFPSGIRRGDLVAFPNTAGYLMHFLESRSHQFSLAKNVRRKGQQGVLDPIDGGTMSAGRGLQ